VLQYLAFEDFDAETRVLPRRDKKCPLYENELFTAKKLCSISVALAL
jgi:hypothetical protein